MPHVTEEIWSQFHDDAPDRRPVARGARARRCRRGRARARFRRRRRSSAAAACAPPLEGDEQRIFDAVVEAGASRRRTATPRPSASACARRSRAREGMLANERFVAERGAGRGRGGAGEARALPARARRDLGLSRLASLSAVARRSFGLEPDAARCSRDARRSAAPLPGRSTSSGRTARPRRRCMTAALLRAEGLRVGAYISPHVRGWAERIQIDGEQADLERALARVRSACRAAARPSSRC